MKNIDKLIINSPYEEPQQCGWVKRNGPNTYLLIMMEEDKRKVEGFFVLRQGGVEYGK